MGKYTYYPPIPPSRKTVVLGWVRDILLAASFAIPLAWGVVVYLAGG